MTRVVLLGVQVFTMAVSVAVGFAVVRLRNTKVIHRYVIISRVIHSCAILLFPLLTTIFASTKAGLCEICSLSVILSVTLCAGLLQK